MILRLNLMLHALMYQTLKSTSVLRGKLVVQSVSSRMQAKYLAKVHWKTLSTKKVKLFGFTSGQPGAHHARDQWHKSTKLSQQTKKDGEIMLE